MVEDSRSGIKHDHSLEVELTHALRALIGEAGLTGQASIWRVDAGSAREVTLNAVSGHH